MSNRTALTEKDKARLFDRLFKKGVLRWRVAPRAVGGKMVEKTFIERGKTKDMFVVEE